MRRKAIAMAGLLALLPAPAMAATVPSSEIAQPLQLRVGEARLVSLSANAASALVARPDVADMQMPARTRAFIFGKAPGRTSVVALGSGGDVLANFDVEVMPDIVRLSEELAGQPGLRVSLSGTAIVLDGEAASPAAAARAAALALAAAGGKADQVINHLAVALPSQVNLRVRVAEVSRTLAREIGFNFDVFGQVGGFSLGLATGREAVGGSGEILRGPRGASSAALVRRTDSLDMNAVIDALEEEGLVTVLVEPNLTARSGETASFLSGGEFPIPVNQNLNNIVVEFKRFGVSLDFTPTVLDAGRISLKVRPEVSELNEAASVEIRDIRVPGLSVRRAETTVELGSGQSFAIAGLVRANQANIRRAVPLLSNIPVLGALFRSTRFQRQETELVIIVTPYLVTPVAPADVTMPAGVTSPATGSGDLLGGRLTTRKPRPGFILE
jgi:pilus assembly protein CpaC